MDILSCPPLQVGMTIMAWRQERARVITSSIHPGMAPTDDQSLFGAHVAKNQQLTLELYATAIRYEIMFLTKTLARISGFEFILTHFPKAKVDEILNHPALVLYNNGIYVDQGAVMEALADPMYEACRRDNRNLLYIELPFEDLQAFQGLKDLHHPDSSHAATARLNQPLTVFSHPHTTPNGRGGGADPPKKSSSPSRGKGRGGGRGANKRSSGSGTTGSNQGSNRNNAGSAPPPPPPPEGGGDKGDKGGKQSSLFPINNANPDVRRGYMEMTDLMASYNDDLFLAFIAAARRINAHFNHSFFEVQSDNPTRLVSLLTSPALQNGWPQQSAPLRIDSTNPSYVYGEYRALACVVTGQDFLHLGKDSTFQTVRARVVANRPPIISSLPTYFASRKSKSNSNST